MHKATLSSRKGSRIDVKEMSFYWLAVRSCNRFGNLESSTRAYPQKEVFWSSFWVNSSPDAFMHMNLFL